MKISKIIIIIIIQRLNESKSWNFEKVKQDGWAQLTKRKEGSQMNRSKNKQGNISTDTKETQIIKGCYKNLYFVK